MLRYFFILNSLLLPGTMERDVWRREGLYQGEPNQGRVQGVKYDFRYRGGGVKDEKADTNWANFSTFYSEIPLFSQNPQIKLF